MPPKLKKILQVEQPTRNWLELSSDLMFNILQRVGVADRLQNVQKVCTAWREICKDPAMWRVVCINGVPGHIKVCGEMCKRAVDRSQGQLVDLTVVHVCNMVLLRYVADSHLRRLTISWGFANMLNEALKKLPLLEELSLFQTRISQEDVEATGRHCPLLKTLKVNLQPFRLRSKDNEVALAIGKNLSRLTHLELIASNIGNAELEAILDGCCHLESLDLRLCWFIDLKGDLGKRCSQQIKHLKPPMMNLEGHLLLLVGSSSIKP